jgi:hypothetical protein
MNFPENENFLRDFGKAPPAPAPGRKPTQAAPAKTYRWKLIWLLTAMAISLGAPFWFDLLNKFMTARSTLKPTKPEKPSKA